MFNIRKSITTATVMWMVASLFYAYQYILRVMPSIMLDGIMLRFHMDSGMVGQFSGIYYIGYSLFHLPIGILLDRYGPRNVIPCCILLSIVGILPIVCTEHWIWPILGRLATGIGSSAAILGVFKIIRMAYSEERFGRMLSFSVMIGLLGAIYGGTPVRYLGKFLNYQMVFAILALVGTLLALITYWVVPPMEDTRDEVRPSSPFAGIGSVLKNAKVMIICLSAGLMVGPLEGFADIWGPKFLNQILHIDASKATFITSMTFMGMCFGSPVLNFIAEKSKSYLGTIIFSGLLMFVIFTLLVTSLLSNTTVLAIGLFLVGICSAYQILAIYKASTYVHENVAGITTAMANMVIMIFGYVLHGMIGSVTKLFGGIEMELAFRWGIAVIPMALLLGVIGFVVVAHMAKKHVKK
ncbi:MAG: MFS transporter [Puniceicoccales bacterium]|jgi:predicted MFS family arabinose efflux permease|nr:MFS transporter [Puniceicoccales bacterium]